MPKLLVAVVLLCAAVPAAQRHASGPPYSPRDALKTFRLADDFQIDIFAAEPLISDPVAMEVDEDGRVYVVEMPGYPLDVTGSGRVMLLEDRNRDGLPDGSTVFADGLKLPTGIMRWKKGVIVTDSPDVLYLEDTDGDGRSDVRRVMLTGFALTNPQHTTNTPIYGLDNWIYLANEGPVRTIRYGTLFGDEGQPVHFPDRDDSPRLPPDADGRNVRFKPDSGQVETLSSRSQFGQTFDAWGHHFLNTNNRHIYQEVIAARYLARNPSLLVPSAVEQVPDYRQPAEVFPITVNPRFELLTDVGVMTSACGLTYYLADLFPASYRNAVFVAEGAHNIVHVASVRDHGVTFRASRMHEGREFLASTDPWFRPVNFYIGPDGALYVVDYYRKLFEHPEWMDEATAKSGDLYAGKDRGRIYRVVPRGAKPAPWMGRMTLGAAGTVELVRRLGEPNIWWRRHAQRLLVDRQASDAAALLEDAARNAAPLGRVHALWALHGLRRATRDVIERALRDPIAGIRENALRVAETSAVPVSPELARALRNDADLKVRFQLLLTLGDDHTGDAQTIRNELLIEQIEDEWMQFAALSAARLDAGALLRQLLTKLTDRETAGRRAVFNRVGATIGAGSDLSAIRTIFREALDVDARSPAWWRAAAIEGLATGLRPAVRRSSDLNPERVLLAQTLLLKDPIVRSAALRLLETIGLPAGGLHPLVAGEAERLATDTTSDVTLRVDAVRLLTLAGAERIEPLLRAVLSRAEPPALQAAAVRALGSVKGSRSAAFFVESWSRWTPAVRDEAVRTFIGDPGRARILLDAVELGKIRSTEIERPLRIRLMMVEDDVLRRRARSLFAEPFTSTKEIVTRYAQAATLAGSSARGRDVFARACSTCHQYRGGAGVAYGPDLGEVRNRLPMSLITDILQPNHSIADGYELWIVQLTDGSSLGGIVSSETPTSVTFRLLGGTERTVSRSQIASMNIADVSAMPDGLDAQINVQQMADLIAFIKGG